jgi:7,8-dihydropterin-6-yl-methyl-4-(beta-D-ribofuranosyl)aminobenzene 5'-phosphate synthase
VPGGRERLRDEDEQDDGADCPRGVRVPDAHRRVEEALHRSSIGAEPDPMIWDDQNAVVSVKDRGLVVVSGCSHAGAINVLRNAQRLTGESRIAGFIGGCHLTGGIFEPIIEPTVEAFARAGVGRVVPAHCSGWRATLLAARMPAAFVQPSVGTVLSF